MGQHEALRCGQGIPSVPLPMVMIAFLFGTMFGVMMGRKSQMMACGWQGGMPGGMHGMHGGPMPGGMHGMGHGMGSHHHHGEGAPPCRHSHGEWPASATDE